MIQCPVPIAKEKCRLTRGSNQWSLESISAAIQKVIQAGYDKREMDKDWATVN